MLILERVRWWLDVRRNRKRHPDLVEQENKGENPRIIAQKMMMRDRVEARKNGIGPNDPRYPTLWDYRMI